MRKLTLAIAALALVASSLMVGDAASRIKGLGHGSQINWGTGTGWVYVDNGVASLAPAPIVTLPIPIQADVTIPPEASGLDQYVITLPAIPVPNTLAVFRNGQIQREGVDYSVAGADITLLHSKCDVGGTVGGCWWTPDDWVRVMYLRLP